jgi:hypothetical protein
LQWSKSGLPGSIFKRPTFTAITSALHTCARKYVHRCSGVTCVIITRPSCHACKLHNRDGTLSDRFVIVFAQNRRRLRFSIPPLRFSVFGVRTRVHRRGSPCVRPARGDPVDRFAWITTRGSADQTHSAGSEPREKCTPGFPNTHRGTTRTPRLRNGSRFETVSVGPQWTEQTQKKKKKKIRKSLPSSKLTPVHLSARQPFISNNTVIPPLFGHFMKHVSHRNLYTKNDENNIGDSNETRATAQQADDHRARKHVNLNNIVYDTTRVPCPNSA